MTIFSTRLFSWRQILIYTTVFVGLVISAQRGLRYVCEHWVAFDCPYYWPVSVFSFRVPSVANIAMAAVVTVAFFLFARFIEIRRSGIAATIIFGVLLIAGTTLSQGFDVGFVAPIAGDAQDGKLVPFSLDGQEYFHDALTITDPADFLRRYDVIQPTLHRHAHTHPPGTILTFYFLIKLLRDPALIGIFLMLIATAGTVYFFNKLLLTEHSEVTSRYLSFLIVLLPAIQVYYLATIDAVIATIVIAAIYLFCFGKGWKSVAGAAVLMTASFLMTFVSLFMLPVMVGFDLIVRRSIRRSLIVVGTLAAVHLVFYFATGYDALHAFRTASHFENPDGFMLFVDPWNYFFTRIEDVSEILFFFGPFLIVLFVRGLKSYGGVKGILASPLTVLTFLGCGTLPAMWAVGAFRTGETARALAFIYPLMLFPVGRYLDQSEAGANERLQLAALVFLQSVGMQAFGNYFW
ncbi:hypothetical protein BH10ACI3_BH10ACI3_17010 [soil metagenome]